MKGSVSSDVEWYRERLPAGTIRSHEYENGDVSLSVRYDAGTEPRDIEASLLGAIVGETSRRWRIALVIYHVIRRKANPRRRPRSRVVVGRDGSTLHTAGVGWQRVSLAPSVFDALNKIRNRVTEMYRSAEYSGIRLRLYYTKAKRVPVKVGE